MPKKVGITGGIGSGKTTVCRIFEAIGIPVYYADDKAKILMTESKSLVRRIKQLLGEDAYTSTGKLNRAYVADIIFSDQKKLEQLNALVHPAVWEDGEKWNDAQNSPYTLKEAALLFESGGHQLLDAVITVTAPEDIRIERVMRRDGVSKEQVKARMQKQWPERQKKELADYVINNDGKSFLIPQVLHIHHAIMKSIKTNNP